MASPADLSAYENIPLQPPPPGQTSNFDSPETRGPAIVVLCSVFIGIMWPIFILRLYSKVWIIRRFGWDDACAIIAAAGATTFAAGVIWSVNYSVFGPHEWDVRAILVTPHVVRIQVLLAGTPVYCVTMLFAKVALLLLYYRVFSLDRWTKIAIYFGITIIALFYIATGVTNFVLCTPWRHEDWTSTSFEKRCDRAEVQSDIQGIFGLVSDLYIFILPLPAVYRVRMSSQKKLAITAVFLTGLIAIAASSVSLYFRVPEANGSDNSWNEPPAAGLAVVEGTIGVICGSAPHLPSYFRRYSAKFSSIAHQLQKLRSGYKTGYKRRYERQSLDVGDHGLKESTPNKPQVETQVLGSIQGEGKFLKSGQLTRMWGDGSTTESSGGGQTLYNNSSNIDNSSTRREYYEMTKLSQQETKVENRPVREKTGSVDATEPTATESSSRRGYWHLLSAFRTTEKDSASQSETHLTA